MALHDEILCELEVFKQHKTGDQGAVAIVGPTNIKYG